MRRAIFLPAKAPRPGRTKTRLSPPLTLAQAADLYRAFLRDSVGVAVGLGVERVALCFPDEPGAAAVLAALVPACVDLRARAEPTLGPTLAGSFRDLLAEGFERVVVLGSDNPTVPTEVVDAALRGLDDHDVVIGPTTDGGYYLLGMARFHPALFERIAWSTDAVYAQTLERAHERRLRVLTMPEWHDVDTVDDLRRLRAGLAELPPSAAPATRAALAALRW